MENVRLSFENAEGSLSVRHFRVEEAISGLFRVEIRAVSPRESLDLSTFVGRRAELQLSGARERLFRGLVESMEMTRISDDNEGLATYEITLVPTLWRLTQRRGNRLFQHLSIPDVVDAILGEWGITHEWRVVREDYPSLELRTQYAETDFAFVSRLLEEAGISFWFVDEGEKDGTLVLGDRPHSGEPRAGQPLPFVDETFQAQAGHVEFVTKLRLREQSRPGRVTVRDYDFWRPRSALFEQADSDRPEERAHEQYHYTPGAYLREANPGRDGSAMVPSGSETPVADDRGKARFRNDFGAHTARLMVEALHAERRVISFETSVNDLSPGAVFLIAGHPRADISGGQPFLVVRHSMEGEVAKPESWRFSASAVFTERPYRPARITPRPRITSIQTAVVVGPSAGGGAEPDPAGGAPEALAAAASLASDVRQAFAATTRLPGGVGELSATALDANAATARLVDNEIYVDEFGRVRVQFPWDRDHDFNGESSIWMRVSQGWAGSGYGMFSIPRVGHEVLVAFVDGDPDSPIIVGRVHNALEPAPFPLPQNKTVSTFRTASSPGGGGFNELRFDDAAGREHVYLQAQNNMDQLVKQNFKEAVGPHRTRSVQKNDNVAVGADRTKFVNQNEIEATGLNRSTVVGLNRLSTVGLEDSTQVGSRWSVTVARGLGGQLTQELERVAGAVGGVMRGAATGVLGFIGNDPLASVAEAALSTFGKAAFDKLRNALQVLDGFQTDPGPPPTCIEMVDRQIKFTTGEASIILDGPNVTITAQGAISFHAMNSVSVLSEEEVGIAAREKVAVVSATDDVIVQAAKDLHLNPYTSGGKPAEAERFIGDPRDALPRCPQCGERMIAGPEGLVCPTEAREEAGH